MLEILSLILHYDEQTVLCAVELTLEAGVPTKTPILNHVPCLQGTNRVRLLVQ